MKIGWHMRGAHYFISITFVITVFSVEISQAATYYVAKTGSDSNSCTQARNSATPKLTITSALSCIGVADGAGAGYTVEVAAGTYNETFDNNIPGGTSWDAPFTLRAAPGASVTIRPNSGAVRVFSLYRNETRYTIIDGFILDGINISADVIKITYNSSGGMSHHIRVKNCEIKNAPRNGILVSNTSDANEFINLDVYNNGSTDQSHGFYITSKNNLIDRCRIYNHVGWGIHIYSGGSGSGKVNNNTVINSTVYSNKEGGILLSSGTGNSAYNNITWGNGGWGGIRIDFGAMSTKVYNNVSYANTSNGIYIGSSSTDANIKNNIAYQNSTNIWDWGTRTVMSNNLMTDPLFVDAVNKNFKLRVGSPAIDRGVTVSEVSYDYAGIPRPKGLEYDIGAYEYHDNDILSPPSNLQVGQ